MTSIIIWISYNAMKQRIGTIWKYPVEHITQNVRGWVKYQPKMVQRPKRGDYDGKTHARYKNFTFALKKGKRVTSHVTAHAYGQSNA